MQAVILAGGKSSRFGAPKALANIAGKTMIERVIETLPATISQTVVVASPFLIRLGLQRHLGDYHHVKVVMQPWPRGTANALSHAVEYIKDDFILMACDTLFAPSDMRHLAGRKPPAFAVKPVGNRRPGAILKDFRIIEKPGKWKRGDDESLMLYVLGTEVFRYLPQISLSKRGEYEIQDAINMYLDNSDSLTLYEVGEYHHLTAMEDYDHIKRLFSSTN